MTEPSIYDLLRKMTELQVELTKVTEKLEHQTQTFEEWKKESQRTADRADVAEDTANEALALAQSVRDEIRRNRKERKADLKWIIGISAPIVLSIIPILIRFYGN